MTLALVEVPYKLGFVCLSFCNARLPKISFLWYFFHEDRHHKIRKGMNPVFLKINWIGSEGSRSPKNDPKIRFLEFWQKYFHWRYAFCFSTKSTSCKNKSFGKNVILELWAKNLKTNQNAGFFKLQYLTNKLGYEVEFLDVTRAIWKQQILVGCFKWLWSDMPGHDQSDCK